MTDAELIEFATEFREGILDGRSSAWMCAAVCMPLVTLLGLHGVKADLMESETETCAHVWLQLEDGRVLDPTADQFQDYQHVALGFKDAPVLPPVYLGSPTILHQNPEPFGN